MPRNQYQDETPSGDRDIVREYERTPPLELSNRDLTMLRTRINGQKERLGERYARDRQFRLVASQHVGVIAFPDGPTIEVRPKVEGANLLYMLRYASGIDSEMFDEPVAVQQGPNFVESVAMLFDAELQALLRSGIRSEYRGTESTERYLRGSLNVAKQLRANPVVSRTSFNCRFNERTADILLNQAVLSAARILARIVSEQRLSERLQSKVDRLRQRVTMRRVEAQELEQIQLSHLTAEYGNVLRLTEMVLTSSYINDYTAGDSMAFSMLIDMNQLWEQCVDRAFRDVAVNSRGLQPRSQYTLGTLVNFGNQEVSMNPDVGIESGSGDTVVVADAKWKQGSPSSSDLYQMAAYQQKGQCSGVLVYPSATSSSVSTGELPSGRSCTVLTTRIGGHETYESFHGQMQRDIARWLRPRTKHIRRDVAREQTTQI